MALLKLVDAKFRTQWDVFNNQNEYATGFLVNTGIAIFSDEMVGTLLGFRNWSGVRYLDEENVYQIGYGAGDPDAEQGITESDAFGELVADFRNKQRIVRRQLPLFAIPQAAYDAVVSLYINTGTWRVVQAEEGTYDLQFALQNANWLLAADMLMRGNVNPDLRKAEARVLYLGQYGAGKDRQQLVTEGIQNLRRQYIAGSMDPFTRRQAEFVYYRQLGAFLPTMSELKQRQIIAQADVQRRQTKPNFVRFTNNVTPEVGLTPKADNYNNDPE